MSGESPNKSCAPTQRKHKVAVALLVALGLLASVESLVGLNVYSSQIDSLRPQDWDSISQRIGDDEPVYVTTDWLDIVAREHLEQANRTISVAPPDLVGIQRFHVLSPKGGQAWSQALANDLGDSPMPEADSSYSAGSLELTTYTQHVAAFAIQDRLFPEQGSSQSSPSLRATMGKHEQRCRPARIGHSTDTWSCKRGNDNLGQIRLEYIEVDHRPRHCAAIDLRSGSSLTIRRDNFEFGTTLRGHLGFDNFNARLRSDSPVQVLVRANDTTFTPMVFSDSMGWAVFELETAPGPGELEVIVLTAAQGTWQGRQYTPTVPLRSCLELRSLVSLNTEQAKGVR